ncbi:polysaccharide biosynthesis C-terminal domain-containing protein [Turicibacter sanguinis]|uniref:polysaccharide biosynthesis C-terminal domain-containing protein n=1 Tax=Turicibacter sanguinis TaxID=154288 RepID=UPI0032F024A8
MRSKKALLNILFSLILQMTTIICGFIVPKLIISNFGSDVNGLISSINQFLGYIVLIEAGMGGVVRAALYNPLAKSDILNISKILNAAEKFFRVIAIIFIAYLVIISIVFPYIVKDQFNYFFSCSLVLIIGISTFFQYYFGISYQILLQADQKKYITTNLQIITIFINTIITIVLIKIGANIHLVKTLSSIIFIIRPIILNYYVSKKYNIVKKIKNQDIDINQKWDGFAHHIAFFLHNNTDIVLLTIFSGTKEVSVYSIYYLVVSSVEKIISTFSSGLEAAFGNMIAKGENENLHRNFNIFELSSFIITTIMYTSTTILILPFVNLYTLGITDIDYYRPIFAYLLILTQAIYCIRAPYNSVVLAAGHYKQTRNGAFIEASINIILSVVLVQLWGGVGLVFGTLCAMIFRTTQYARYLSNHILKRDIWIFWKKISVYLINALVLIYILDTNMMQILDSYSKWAIYSVIITLIVSITTFFTSLLFYFKDMKNLYLLLKNLLINTGIYNRVKYYLHKV